MKQTSKRFTSILLALLFFVGALMVFFDLVQPAYSDMESVKSQVESNGKFLQDEAAVIKQVQQLVKTSQDSTQEEQAIGAVLPIGSNVASALAQIYGVAGVDNMAIQSVGVSLQSPQQQSSAIQSVSGNATSAAAIAGGGQVVRPYGTASFSVTMTGSYENFKSFLNHIETNVRLFDVKSVAFQTATPQAGKSGVVTPDYFNYTLNISAYYEPALQ